MFKLLEIMRHYAFLLSVILFFAVFVMLVPKQPAKTVAVDTRIVQSTASTQKPVNIFTPDWGIASTLLAMGYTPEAIPEIDGYDTWASSPPIPAGVKDVGLRYFPNMEMLHSLNPDVVIDIDFYQLLRPLYKQDTPIVTANLGREREDLYAKPQWQEMHPSLYSLSEQINPQFSKDNHNVFVDDYMQQRAELIQKAGKRIQAVVGVDKKFAIVEMYDTRSVNFIAENSLIQLTMDMMDLPMVTRGKASKWGTSTKNISELLDLPKNTCLIINKPITPFFKYQLQRSLVWKQTPFSQPDSCLYVVDSVWLTAGVESMVNFAEYFAVAVENNDKDGLVL